MIQRGFTIVEVLIVIVVIGILATVTAMTYLNVRDDAHDTSVQNDMRAIAANLEKYRAKYGDYPAGDTELSDPAMSFQLAKDSYAKDGLQSGMNVLYCRVSATNSSGASNDAASPQSFALVAESMSGAVYSYTSAEDIITEEDAWRNESSRSTCNALGIPQINTSDRDLFYYNNSWRSYVQ